MARVTKKLVRQIARHLGGEDAAEKLAALSDLLREKPEIFKDYHPIAEGFPAFLESIEEAYSQYEDKSKMAVRNLQLSSDELNKVNRKLEFLNSSMNAMLESLGPGLLFFDRGGLCSTVFSKSCRDYLETDPGGKYIWDILGLDKTEAENLEALLKYMFSNDSAMSFDDLMALAPRTKNHSRGMVLQIEYRPMRGFGADIQGVLVIVIDRTHEEAAKKLIQEKEKAAGRILRLAKNRNGFQQFALRLHEYFLDPDGAEYKSEDGAEDIRRMVHTLKGLAGTFFADGIGSVLHRVEDEISGPDKTPEKIKSVIAAHTGRIGVLYKDMLAEAERLFGADFIAQGETKTINHEKLRGFFALLSGRKIPRNIAEVFMREFLAVPVWEKLEPMDYMLQEMAGRTGKKVSCRLEGENFLLLEMPYRMFFSALVHITRNIVDHGIETEDMRRLLEKPRAGSVLIRTEPFLRKKQEWFRVTISDDGAGINMEVMQKRLAKAGVSTAKMSNDEVLQKIFEPGFSTRDSVSQFSGRGVGLNVVYEEVARLGGDITVQSRPGHGTSFIIELPFIWNGVI